MAEAWHIARSNKVCSATGQDIEPGVAFYSALIEEGDLFQRRDYSSEAWPEVEKANFFSYWKNKGWQPGEQSKAKAIDYDRLLSFFDDLSNAEENHRRLFRYVVALILSRKRILRLDDLRRLEDGDCLVLYDRRSQTVLEVAAPPATPEQLKSVQEQLNALFDLDAEAAE